MWFLAEIDLTLPLRNPVIIFCIVLFIILFAPILLNKVRIPHIIGLIIAGVIIGPYGLNLLRRDSSIVLFGTVGLLYIMFLAGLEIDLSEFRKNKHRSIVFGLFTFIIPMILGTLATYYLLRFNIVSSVLLASMFASHTLLAYPIISRYGITRNTAVTLAVGGTVITDTMALLVLAVITALARGSIGVGFWMQLIIGIILFSAIVLFIFPIIARWFFKRFDDSISQFIFVLAMVFLGALLAEFAGIEAIIGAFLSGLALNRFIPHASPLMSRIDFVGNALFIPFFLIGVGMLVDVSVLLRPGALKVAAVMITVAVSAKFLAAWLTQKTFRLSVHQRRIIFGLSTAQAAATLAAVLVGYNLIIGETVSGEPIRLLNEDVLNGTILMILVTCTIASIAAERAARVIALEQEQTEETETTPQEKIMVCLRSPETADELVNLGLSLKSEKTNTPVYALHVVTDSVSASQSRSWSEKLMNKALAHAASTQQTIIPVTRHDVNLANGMVYSVKEQNITDLVIGVDGDADLAELLGNTTEKVLRSFADEVMLYKPVQPLNTIRRMVVAITPRAEMEPGFAHWLNKIMVVGKRMGCAMEFFGSNDSLRALQQVQPTAHRQLSITYTEFSDWNDFLVLTREVRRDDLFVVIASRKGHVSHHPFQDKMPQYLSKYFSRNSCIIIFPVQVERGLQMSNLQHVDTSLAESLVEAGVINRAGSFISRIFSRKKRE